MSPGKTSVLVVLWLCCMQLGSVFLLCSVSKHQGHLQHYTGHSSERRSVVSGLILTRLPTGGTLISLDR